MPRHKGPLALPLPAPATITILNSSKTCPNAYSFPHKSHLEVLGLDGSVKTAFYLP